MFLCGLTPSLHGKYFTIIKKDWQSAYENILLWYQNDIMRKVQKMFYALKSVWHYFGLTIETTVWYYTSALKKRCANILTE